MSFHVIVWSFNFKSRLRKRGGLESQAIASLRAKPNLTPRKKPKKAVYTSQTLSKPTALSRVCLKRPVCYCSDSEFGNPYLIDLSSLSPFISATVARFVTSNSRSLPSIASDLETLNRDVDSAGNVIVLLADVSAIPQVEKISQGPSYYPFASRAEIR